MSTMPDAPAPADPGGGLRTYRAVVRTSGMRAWTIVVVCQRLPIAMSPLALVYLGHLAGSSTPSAPCWPRCSPPRRRSRPE
jgi:hypothetical protein